MGQSLFRKVVKPKRLTVSADLSGTLSFTDKATNIAFAVSQSVEISALLKTAHLIEGQRIMVQNDSLDPVLIAAVLMTHGAQTTIGVGQASIFEYIGGKFDSTAGATERVGKDNLVTSNDPLDTQILAWNDSLAAMQWVNQPGSGGVSGLDTFYVEDFESLDILDITRGNDAIVNNGGALAGTLSWEGVAPISGVRSLKYTMAAGSLNDWWLLPPKPIDVKPRGNWVNAIAYYTYNGDAGDIQFLGYDLTEGKVVTPQVKTFSTAAGATRFAVSMLVPIGTTSITTGAHVLQANAGKELVFDSVEYTVNPFVNSDMIKIQSRFLQQNQSNMYGGISGPTHFLGYNFGGSITSIESGDSEDLFDVVSEMGAFYMETKWVARSPIMFSIDISGSAASASRQIQLWKYGEGGTEFMDFSPSDGQWERIVGSGVMFLNTGEYVKLRGTLDNGSSAFRTRATAIGKASNVISPLESIQPARYTSSAGGTLSTTGTDYYLDFENKDYDLDDLILGAGAGRVIATNTGWKGVAKYNGRYRINTEMSIVTLAAERVLFQVRVNNVIKAEKTYNDDNSPSITRYHNPQIDITPILSAGDRVEIVMSFFNGSAVNFLGGDHNNWVEMQYQDRQPLSGAFPPVLVTSSSSGDIDVVTDTGAGTVDLNIASASLDPTHLDAIGAPTDGQVLTWNNASSQFEWVDALGGFTDPMTTRGDVLVRDASNTTARLGIGTAGHVLTSDGTDVGWVAPPSGGEGGGGLRTYNSGNHLPLVVEGSIIIPGNGATVFWDGPTIIKGDVYFSGIDSALMSVTVDSKIEIYGNVYNVYPGPSASTSKIWNAGVHNTAQADSIFVHGIVHGAIEINSTANGTTYGGRIKLGGIVGPNDPHRTGTASIKASGSSNSGSTRGGADIVVYGACIVQNIESNGSFRSTNGWADGGDAGAVTLRGNTVVYGTISTLGGNARKLSTDADSTLSKVGGNGGFVTLYGGGYIANIVTSGGYAVGTSGGGANGGSARSVSAFRHLKCSSIISIGGIASGTGLSGGPGFFKAAAGCHIGTYTATGNDQFYRMELSGDCSIGTLVTNNSNNVHVQPIPGYSTRLSLGAWTGIKKLSSSTGVIGGVPLPISAGSFESQHYTWYPTPLADWQYHLSSGTVGI